MEWITAVRKSVKFIEEHLKDKISAQDVADQVYMSLLHFQKGFQVLTGYSVTEYIRNPGKYAGGKVPESIMLYEFPQGEWAVFDCVGAVPDALQSLNTRIFKEWLPGNPDFEISGNANVEWYDCMNGEKTDPDYHSAVWIPVKRK